MKYIRTKDGRIAEIDTKLMLPDDKPYKGEGIGQYCGVPIVAQSDNLEDLCDEIVAFKRKADGYDWGILNAKDYICGFKHEMDEYHDDGYSIYAANWADKGLIYVAKWDGKEWELV